MSDVLAGQEHDDAMRMRRLCQAEEEQKRQIQEEAAEENKIQAEDEGNFEEEMQKKAADRAESQRKSVTSSGLQQDEDEYAKDPLIAKQTASTNARTDITPKNPIQGATNRDQEIKDQHTRAAAAREQGVTKDQETTNVQRIKELNEESSKESAPKTPARDAGHKSSQNK